MIQHARPRSSHHRRSIAWALSASLTAILALAPLAPASADPTERLPVLTPPEDIASLVTDSHPRLMVDDAALAGISDRIATEELSADLYQDLLARADGYLDAPVVENDPPFGNGRTLLLETREVQTRLYVLGLAYRLSGNVLYADRAYTEMAAVAEFADWNPESFLSVAELLNGFAVGYDWLYDYLDAAQRQVVREAIVTLGLEPAIAEHESGASWTTGTNNWNVVCNSGMIMAALAIADEEPELANTVLHHAFDSLPIALAEYGPDGGYPEGIVYWGYATRFLVSAMSSLETAVGDDFGITETPGLDRTVDFAIAMTGPTGLQFNYNDASTGGHTGAPATHWLASHYQNPAYAWWGEAGAVQDPLPLPPLHLMWQGLLDPVPPNQAGLPLDRQFDVVGTYLSRSAWDISTANFFGFKAGDNAASHGDLDMGTFVIDAAGTRWAMELGAENYSQPGYWETGPEGRRWHYYRKRPEGQNTLVINPDATTGQSTEATGSIISTGAGPDGSFVVADLSEAYAAQGVTSWQRGVAMIDGRSRFIVQDELSATEPVEAWWFMHTNAQIDVADDGQTAILELNGRTMLASLLDAPAGAEFSVMDAVPLPTSPNPSGQTANAGVRKLVVTSDPTAQMRLSVLLEPLPTGTPQPRPAVVDLVEWSVEGDGAAALADLQVDGATITGFSPDSRTYVLDRPGGSALPVVTATGADGAAVTIEQASGLPGTATVCVAGSAGACAARYTVSFADPYANDVVASVVGTNPAERATDHDLTTFWSAQGEGQWIQANFAQPRTVDGVGLAWSRGDERVYDVEILTSLDGVVWTEPVPASSSGTTLEIETHAIEPVSARYVRVVGYGNSANAWNSLAELRVYSGGQSWPDAPAAEPTLDSLDLGGSSLTVDVQGVSQLAIGAGYTDGSTRPVDAGDVTLVSSDPAVATVSADGRVVGLAAGSAEISARYRDDDGRLAFARLAVEVVDPTQMIIPAARDAYIRDGEWSTENYGHLSSMVVKDGRGSPGFSRQALLAFDLTEVPMENLVSASLHVWAQVTVDRQMEVAVHPAGTDWTEESVTWDSRPSIEEIPVATFVAPATRTELTVDVTELVQGAAGGEVGLALLQAVGDTQAYGASVSSGESDGMVPALVLELSESPCGAELTGPVAGPVTVAAQESVCMTGADVEGPVSVANGGSLIVTGSDIAGPVRIDGDARVVVADSTVTGPVTSTGAGSVQWWEDVEVDGPFSVGAGSGDVVLADVGVRGPLSCSGNVRDPILLGTTAPGSGQCG